MALVMILKEYRPTCMVEVYEKFNKYPVNTTFDFFFSKGYRCFYNHKGQGLKMVRDMNEALESLLRYQKLLTETFCLLYDNIRTRHNKCLSHQLWPAIKKGWKDEGKPVHFWGLGGNNISEIREVETKGEEWWYVDVGYITEQITRYPEPIIHNYDKTYFRICKGRIHSTKGKVGNGQRLYKLRHQGIDAEFKGWNTGETNHILLCPSSQTVTYHIDGLSQQDWIQTLGNELILNGLRNQLS